MYVCFSFVICLSRIVIAFIILMILNLLSLNRNYENLKFYYKKQFQNKILVICYLILSKDQKNIRSVLQVV